MEHKFINRTKKMALSQINIKEYFEFYINFICPYRYLYKLEDSTEIEINFNEKHFSHLLGLHKFRGIKSYNTAKEINDNILNNKITFKNLYLSDSELINKNTELRDRISYFPVLRTLLDNTDTALKYDLNVIWNSKIEFSFLLKTDKISVLIYLAIKEVNENKKICVPVSFLVDRNNRFSKMKLKELKIEKINIIKK